MGLWFGEAYEKKIGLKFRGKLAIEWVGVDCREILGLWL